MIVMIGFNCDWRRSHKRCQEEESKGVRNRFLKGHKRCQERKQTCQAPNPAFWIETVPESFSVCTGTAYYALPLNPKTKSVVFLQNSSQPCKNKNTIGCTLSKDSSVVKKTKCLLIRPSLMTQVRSQHTRLNSVICRPVCSQSPRTRAWAENWRPKSEGAVRSARCGGRGGPRR